MCAFIGCSEPATPDPGSGGASSGGSAGTSSSKAGTGGTPGTGGNAGTTSNAGSSMGGTTPTAGKGGVSGSAGSSSGSGGTGTAGQSGSGGSSAGTAGTTSAGGASAGTGTGATSGGGSGGEGQGGSGAGTAGTGGSGTAGTGGGGNRTEGPCDIYADAELPCVAAYSVVRALSSAYAGPLYQLRKGGPDPNTGSGGTTMDIGLKANGFADFAAHEAFCAGNEPCTFATIYDQSGRENHLTVGKAGCYEGTAAEDDYESDAKRRPMTVGGNDVYALYMDKHEGYRDNTTSGMPTGNTSQGIYMVAEGSGRRQGAGCCCCWNFGNASTDNCYGPSGQMNALYLGIGYWGKGTGSGPWFMGDFEAGVWAGGTGASNAVNNMSPSMTMDYAFGILKTSPTNYAIRVADATTGNITTAYDGGIPTAFNGRWTMEGGIILGIGGDNSNSSDGTFLEGAITAGRPTDETDALVHANVKAAGYGN